MCDDLTKHLNYVHSSGSTVRGFRVVNKYPGVPPFFIKDLSGLKVYSGRQ